MPKRRAPKRRYKRRRKVPKNTSLTKQHPMMPLGKTHKFVTRYADYSVTLNPGIAGAPASYVFSLNGLYDPDITGGGRQPLGFDQVMLMYDHYTVIYAKATVHFSNQDTSFSQICALQLRDSATTTTDMENVLENSGTVYTVVAPFQTGGSVKELTISCSPSKWFGRKVLGSTTYQGNLNANPTDQVYLHCVAQPQFAADSSEVRCSVLIEYTVILTEPKNLGPS